MDLSRLYTATYFQTNETSFFFVAPGGVTSQPGFQIFNAFYIFLRFQRHDRFRNNKDFKVRDYGCHNFKVKADFKSSTTTKR